MNRAVLAAIGLLTLAGCSSAPEPKREAAAAPTPPKEAEAPKTALPPSRVGAPDVFKVRFDTSKGPFVVEVHREWAPLGADRFYELVKDKFYDEARFFRVVPNFVVQFGLAASPAKTKKWDKPIKDDPVVRTNRGGSVVFATAGPNTRTSQVFINLRMNASLDQDGFAPFGQVVEGMEVVEKLYAGYGDTLDQGRITSRGNAYLASAAPKLDYIRKATIQ